VKVLRLFSEPLLERSGVFETATLLHGAPLSIPEEGGSATGVLGTDKYPGQFGDPEAICADVIGSYWGWVIS
jgi:hypothetical protein